MADIKINDTQWDPLSDNEKQRITEGLKRVGSLRSDDVIIGDPSVPPFTGDTQMEPMWNPIKDLCKAACDVAAGAAIAWCTANTAGTGLAACVAAAEVARRECKRRC